MQTHSIIDSEMLIAIILKGGGVGVLPTDTMYGIVGSALQRRTVERIYRLRARRSGKPMIVLISSMRDLALFGVAVRGKTKKVLQKVWPGKVSVILPCPSKRFVYLHRGKKTLAFRMPESAWLRALLARTGPLVAPSANVENEAPARTIAEARRYFGENVEFYGNVRRIASKPSTLISIGDAGVVTVLRQGAAKININLK